MVKEEGDREQNGVPEVRRGEWFREERVLSTD